MVRPLPLPNSCLVFSSGNMDCLFFIFYQWAHNDKLHLVPLRLCILYSALWPFFVFFWIVTMVTPQ
ncbi:hypothetical protein BDF21DRAFT_414819 [Thamnidium elegans]|nr:hypothetical protein BDF21DRAFT_414819 [Thamnidium elegans]